MNSASLSVLKLKNDLELLIKEPTVVNGENLLKKIEKFRGENFQFVEKFFLPRLLIVLDDNAL